MTVLSHLGPAAFSAVPADAGAGESRREAAAAAARAVIFAAHAAHRVPKPAQPVPRPAATRRHCGSVTSRKWWRATASSRRSGVSAKPVSNVTPEEFKGRRPIRRPGLELPIDPHDFDNPLVARSFRGSRRAARAASAFAVPVDFRRFAHEAATGVQAFLDGFGLRERPVAGWRAMPPVTSGIKMLLSYAKVGLTVERWFAQNKLPETPDTAASIQFTRSLLDGARSLGRPLPEPEYVHQDDAVTIARWLAGCRAAGRVAQLDTNTSSAVRVCLAALDHGLDISEASSGLAASLTPRQRRKVILRAGCRAASHYQSTEAGCIGAACTASGPCRRSPSVDRQACHSCGARPPATQRAVPTTAKDPAPDNACCRARAKIMLNVDSGDCGEISRRECGCPLGALGLDLHAWHLRSVEKITSEGLSYLRGDLVPFGRAILPRTVRRQRHRLSAGGG